MNCMRFIALIQGNARLEWPFFVFSVAQHSTKHTESMKRRLKKIK